MTVTIPDSIAEQISDEELRLEVAIIFYEKGNSDGVCGDTELYKNFVLSFPEDNKITLLTRFQQTTNL